MHALVLSLVFGALARDSGAIPESEFLHGFLSGNATTVIDDWHYGHVTLQGNFTPKLGNPARSPMGDSPMDGRSGAPRDAQAWRRCYLNASAGASVTASAPSDTEQSYSLVVYKEKITSPFFQVEVSSTFYNGTFFGRYHYDNLLHRGRCIAAKFVYELVILYAHNCIMRNGDETQFNVTMHGWSPPRARQRARDRSVCIQGSVNATHQHLYGGCD